jgi:hypothetical protein
MQASTSDAGASLACRTALEAKYLRSRLKSEPIRTSKTSSPIGMDGLN